MHLSITCRHTGIQGTIDLPAVKGKALEYTHPLSSIESVYQVLRTEGYVRRLDKSILSGIIITQLKAYDLYHSAESHPTAINASLSISKKSELLKLITVLDDYVKPMHQAKRSINIPKVNLDNGVCIKAIGQIILSSITNIPEGSELDTEEYILRKELREKQAAEAYRRLEISRQQRAEQAKDIAAKKKTFSLEDLEPKGAQPSIVSTFLKGKTLDTATPALTSLYKLALSQVKKSCILGNKQITILSSLTSIITTMDTSKRATIIEKLGKYDSKYIKDVQRILKLCDELCSLQSVSVEDSIDSIEAEQKKPNARAILAKLRGAKR